MSLKGSLVRLAYRCPDLRSHLLPLIVEKIATEEVPSDVQDFLGKLESTVKKYFPKGYFRAQVDKGLGRPSILMITATLPLGEQPRGIVQNDPSYNTFWMHNAYTSEGLNPKIKVELTQGGRLMGPNASNSQKIGWRDKSGTPMQILVHFDRYYAKLKSMVG